MPQSDGSVKDAEGNDLERVPSSELYAAFADHLARAGHRDERIVITLYGKDHAALIPMRDLLRLLELDRASADAA